jgi:hypothetical protein
MNKKAKPAGWMVLFDDEMGVCVPMGPDSDCEGAICASNEPLLFPSREAAKKAVIISGRWANLNKAQGKPAIEDFLPPSLKYIKIIPVFHP